jgi:hypothetical protein
VEHREFGVVGRTGPAFLALFVLEEVAMVLSEIEVEPRRRAEHSGAVGAPDTRPIQPTGQLNTRALRQHLCPGVHQAGPGDETKLAWAIRVVQVSRDWDGQAMTPSTSASQAWFLTTGEL